MSWNTSLQREQKQLLSTWSHTAAPTHTHIQTHTHSHISAKTKFPSAERQTQEESSRWWTGTFITVRQLKGLFNHCYHWSTEDSLCCTPKAVHCVQCGRMEDIFQGGLKWGEGWCLNAMNRNTPTLWVWSLPFHTLGKAHRQQRGKTQLRGETAEGWDAYLRRGLRHRKSRLGRPSH